MPKWNRNSYLQAFNMISNQVNVKKSLNFQYSVLHFPHEISFKSFLRFNHYLLKRQTNKYSNELACSNIFSCFVVGRQLQITIGMKLSVLRYANTCHTFLLHFGENTGELTKHKKEEISSDRSTVLGKCVMLCILNLLSLKASEASLKKYSSRLFSNTFLNI